MKTNTQSTESSNNRSSLINTPEVIALLEKSIQNLVNWIEYHQYKGYEPFDGLSSYLKPLTFSNWFAQRVLQQLVLRCPFHVRPLLGIRPLKSTKGMGFIARGYLRMFALTGDPDYGNKAKYCLDWLIENRSPGYKGYSWGNHFDYAARPFQLPKFTPTVVWTSHIGQVFLDAVEILNESRYLEVASDICRHILEELPREKTSAGTCISYVPFKQMSLHNSNMLAAAMLARTASYTGNEKASEVAREAMRYSVTRQLMSGGWYYGEEETYHWVDNWHTAYNLDSLKCYTDYSDDKSFETNIEKGLKFYKEVFFQEDGTPYYYANRLHLVDIQCASQAIDTLSYFSQHDEDCLSLARIVANWTIENMQDKSGYFYYRKLSWKDVKIPMLHWGQGTMFSALSHLLLKLKNEAGS